MDFVEPSISLSVCQSACVCVCVCVRACVRECVCVCQSFSLSSRLFFVNLLFVKIIYRRQNVHMVTVHNVADDNMCRCITAHFVVYYAGGKEGSSRHIFSSATICADGRQYVQWGSVHIVADDNMYKTTICTVRIAQHEIAYEARLCDKHTNYIHKTIKKILKQQQLWLSRIHISYPTIPLYTS